ncbi:MAG: pantetheine-phosphate adenylyltransferase [Isosphaeraceae bacterium]
MNQDQRGTGEPPDEPHTYRKAVFTGTFDPLTLGHLDVIRRGLRCSTTWWSPSASTRERRAALRHRRARRQSPAGSWPDYPDVSVESFEELTVQYVRRIGARVILRGLRTLSDMEYEFGMTLTNHRLDPGVETVFLMADGEYSHVSSSLIKQVARFGGAEALQRFVPPDLIEPIMARMASVYRA